MLICVVYRLYGWCTLSWWSKLSEALRL